MAQWLMKHLSLCLDKACELRSCQKESFSALEAGKERESRCGDGERERRKETLRREQDRLMRTTF